MCPCADHFEMETSNGMRTISENGDGDRREKSSVSFEDALTLTGFGKFNILSIIFVGFLLMGMIMETLGFSYVIPACQCDLNLTLTQKGWLAAIPFIGIILTSHMWGYLADTRGRKKILVFSMGVGSFFSVLSSFSPDLITFMALRFIASIFISAPSSIGYAYLGELNPLKQRDIALTLGNGFVALGTAVVPLVAWAILPSDFHINMGFISDYRPWRLLVSVFALPFAICSFVFAYFPQSPKYLANRGKHDEALEVLQRIYAINFNKPAKDFPITELEHDVPVDTNNREKSILNDIWNQTVPLFKSPYMRYTIITCFLQFCTFSVTNGFYIWFPTILNKVFETEHMKIDEPSNMCSLLSNRESYITVSENNTIPSQISSCDDSLNTKTFSISILLSCIVSIVTMVSAFLIKITGKRNILLVIFTVNAICTLVIHWVSNTITSIVLFSSIQLSGTCIGIINAYVIEIFPTNVRAMGVCLSLMIGRVGSVFGTNVIGLLIEIACPASFFLFGGLLLSCALVCLALPSKPLDFSKAERKIEENNTT